MEIHTEALSHRFPENIPMFLGLVILKAALIIHLFCHMSLMRRKLRLHLLIFFSCCRQFLNDLKEGEKRLTFNTKEKSWCFFSA